MYEPADATILKDADIGVNVQAYDADILKADTSDNLTVGFTTDVETLTSDTITPDLTNEWLKVRSVVGNVTINAPVTGYGGCLIRLIIDASGPYTITLGSGVYPIGTLPDLESTKTYECKVVKHTGSTTTVEIVEIVQ